LINHQEFSLAIQREHKHELQELTGIRIIFLKRFHGICKRFDFINAIRSIRALNSCNDQYRQRI